MKFNSENQAVPRLRINAFGYEYFDVSQEELLTKILDRQQELNRGCRLLIKRKRPKLIKKKVAVVINFF